MVRRRAHQRPTCRQALGGGKLGEGGHQRYEPPGPRPPRGDAATACRSDARRSTRQSCHRSAAGNVGSALVSSRSRA